MVKCNMNFLYDKIILKNNFIEDRYFLILNMVSLT
jgi:hypothetical protein